MGEEAGGSAAEGGFLTQTPAVATKTAPVLKAVATGRGGQSLVNPDARGGFPKKDKPFFGYKPIIAGDQGGFITGLPILPGNESEASALDPLLDDLAFRPLLKPKRAVDKG